MYTKEKRSIHIPFKNKNFQDRRFNIKLTIVLVFLVIVALFITTISGFSALNDTKAVVEKQSQEITRLREQIATLQSDLKKAEQKSDTLQSKNDALQKEVEAYKAQIGKFGLQYPAEAYEGKKLVALTFDDGPGQYTAELLDFMKKQNVHATFFLLGTNVARYPDLVKRMEAEGHVVGNHSYSHANYTSLSASNIAAQLEKCNAAIRSAVGHNALVMRCPGGSYNNTVLSVAKTAAVPVIHWSLDTLDWKLRDKEKILTRTFDELGVKDGDIILMHDIHRQSVDAAKEMIRRLKKDGYTFVTIPELLSVRKDGMQSGVLYTSGIKTN